MTQETPASFDGKLSTSTYPNRFNVVIPAEGPFYRTGLVLTVDVVTNGVTTQQPLIEGLDYYLGYYYKEASEVFEDAIYGGIILLNHTDINYTILSVGRNYRIPQSEIGKWLVSTDLVDPRNVDWSDLMRYAPTIPAIDPPKDIDEAIARDEVVAALNDIRAGILARVAEMDVAYAEVTDLIFQNGEKVFNEELYQHHLLKGQGHSYTAADIGALKVTAKAVDATKAFSRTIDELTALMTTSGIQKAQLDALLRNDLELQTLFGRMRVLNNEILTFQTADQNHVVSMKGDTITITAKKPIVAKADMANDNKGMATELSAGYNTLWTPSGPDALAPIFNGVYLITPDMVSLYLHETVLQPANAYFESTATVKMYGQAKDYSPLRIDVVLPEADIGVLGLVKVTSLRTNLTPGFAISQNAVTQMQTLLGDYVDATYTVNGKGFDATQTLTLTKNDFGVEKVNNTSPADKPVTKLQTAALLKKALKTHTHVFGDLTGVPIGSATLNGLLYLWDVIDTTNNKAINSQQGFNFEKDIAALETKANGLIPGWAVIGASYGNPGFLPIPAQGNYEGFAKDNLHLQAVIGVQENRLYVLRNGHSGTPDTQYIYYGYGNLDETGAVSDTVQTSFRYRPAGLATRYPNVELRDVLCAGPDAFIALGDDGNYYLIMLNGTMDYRKHTDVVQVTFPDYDTAAVPNIAFVPDQQMDLIEIDANNVYVCRTDVQGNSASTGIYRVGLYSLPRTALTGTSAAFTQANLSFSRKAGKCADIVEPGPVELGDATSQRIGYATQAGLSTWNRYQELTRGPCQNLVGGIKSGKFRVSNNSRNVLFSLTTSRNFGMWTAAYNINLSTLVVTLETPGVFPLKIDTEGVFKADGTTSKQQKWPGRASGYTAANRINVGNMIYSYVVSTETVRLPALSQMALPDGVSFYDFIALDSGTASNAEVELAGGRGSDYGPGMSAPLFFPGTQKVWVNDVLGTDCVEAEYDPNGSYGVAGYNGFGPTNNRRVVDWAEYAKAAQIPLVINQANPDGILDGVHFQEPGTQAYKVTKGSTSLTSDRLTISSAEWNKMVAAVVNGAPTGSANGFASERILEANGVGATAIAFDLWVVGTTQPGGPSFFVQVSTMNFVTDRNVNGIYMFQVYPTISNGQVTFNVATINLLGQRNTLTWNATSIGQKAWQSGRNIRMAQASFYTADGVTFRFTINNSVNVNVQAGNIGARLSMTLTKSGGNYTGTLSVLTAQNYLINPAYETYIPDLNGYMITTFALDAVFLSGPYYTAAQMLAGQASTSNIIVAGVKTAEGWILYLTEAVRFFINSMAYTVPTYSIDFSATFPTAYRNQTFYFHVETYLDGNVTKARYLVSLTKYPDSNTRLFIGTVTTDGSRITATDLKPVKRLGNVRQLSEHAGTVYEHDSNPPRELTDSPLGLLRPYGIVQTPVTGYLGQAGLSAVGSLVARPVVTRLIPAATPWYSGSSKAEQFWRKADALAIPQATSADAFALGMIKIAPTLASVMAGGAKFGAKFNVTSTNVKLRIKLAVDDVADIYIDGVLRGSGYTGYTTVGVYDFYVTRGLHNVAIECKQGLNNPKSPCYVSYIVYDYDGTTERELTRSTGNSVVGYTSSAGPDAVSGDVLETTSYLYTATASQTPMVAVTTPDIPFTPPFKDVATGLNHEVIVATKFLGADGTLYTLSELTVNLMLIPTSDLSS